MKKELHEAFYQKSDRLLCTLDYEGCFIEINPRWQSMLGYAATDLFGKTIADFIHPEDLEYCTKSIQDLLESKNSASFEIRMRKKNQEYIWLLWSVSFLPELGVFSASGSDVSEYKDQQILLEKIQEAAKIGYWSIQTKEMRPMWSTGTFRIHGVPLEEPVKLDEAIDFYVGESKERITELFGRAISDAVPFDSIFQIKDRQGVIKWVRSIGLPKKDGEDSVEEVHGVFQDVTKDKIYDENVQMANKRLELALDASGIGVWEYDLVNGSLHWDAKMYAIYGVEEKDFSGAYEAWSNGLHPEDKERAEAEVADAIAGKGVFDSEFRVVWPDQSIRYVKAKATVVVDQNDKAIKMLGVNWDITESKLASELLENEKTKALQASKAKSEFLSNMSHEIRTPMNGLMGYLALLSETSLEKKQEQYLKIVSESCNSLYSIINDILDYSKIEAGRMVIKREKVFVNEIVKKVCSLFFAAAGNKGVIIKTESRLDPKAQALLDELRITQILSNLLGNATKFTDRGSIIVGVYYEEQENKIVFSVEDTGAGMAQELLEKIFKPFSQGEQRTNNSVAGTGLGLSIVKKLVTLMDGELTVASELDKGSKFVVKIPSQIEIANSEVRSPDMTHNKSEFDGQGDIKALVVDDNAINRDLLQARLNKMGVESVLCSSGEEAIEEVQNLEFDLIFMDIQMPIMDGYAATKEILNLLKGNAPPIYALTANAFEDDKKKSLAAGMAGHLNKPIKVQDLAEVLSIIQEKKAS